MIKKQFTSVLLALMVLFTTTLSSCLGGFKAFNSLKDWNSSVTDNKFINNLLFWVLLIIPVYHLFFFGDVVILNVIEFWTGSNPLGMKAGEIESQKITLNGVDYTLTASKNKMTLFNANGDEVSNLTFDSKDNSWSVAENGASQKIVALENMNGLDANFKVFNANGEADVFTVNAFSLKKQNEYVKF